MVVVMSMPVTVGMVPSVAFIVCSFRSINAVIVVASGIPTAMSRLRHVSIMLTRTGISKPFTVVFWSVAVVGTTAALALRQGIGTP